MRVILTILSSFIVSCLSAQYCNLSSLIDMQVKLSLESDIYYYLDFKRDEIPLPKIYYSNEPIPLNLKRFSIKLIESQREDESKDLELIKIGASKEESNYIVFNSGLIQNYIMLEIFFTREEYLNRPDRSEYETWRRFNSGISYLFEFDDMGCLIKIEKSPISYD